MEEDFRTLAQCYMSLMEGDTHQIETAMEIMKNHGFLDDDGELIYEEDEYVEEIDFEAEDGDEKEY